MGFTDIFSRKAIGFHRQAKLFEQKFVPPDGQTRQTKTGITAGQFAQYLALSETPGNRYTDK